MAVAEAAKNEAILPAEWSQREEEDCAVSAFD